MPVADVKVRDQLKGIRAQAQDLQSQRAAAAKERERAKEAFGTADFTDQKMTETPEFKDAEKAVADLGRIQDELNELREAENGILQMLGESEDSQVNAKGARDDGHSGGWNGHTLLAASDAYHSAVENGLFSSNSHFGTVQIGEIATREEFLAALPAAPAGVIGTPPGQSVQPDYRGVLPVQLRALSLLDLIPSGTTDSNIVSYVQVTATPQSAAETAELDTKPQEGLTTVDATAPVRTIAGWVKVARQAMDDVAGLATLINTLLPYDVRRRMEAQIIAGDGVGQNILGILNTAGVGAPALVAGDNIADSILRAMTVVILSDNDPNFVALNPVAWQDLLLMKTGSTGTTTDTWSGNYLYGAPNQPQAPTIWGLNVTRNRAVPTATPLVGDSMGATILVREAVNIRTSDADQDDFIRNRVTVLAEARIAFPVWRPTAFAIAAQG